MTQTAATQPIAADTALASLHFPGSIAHSDPTSHAVTLRDPAGAPVVIEGDLPELLTLIDAVRLLIHQALAQTSIQQTHDAGDISPSDAKLTEVTVERHLRMSTTHTILADLDSGLQHLHRRNPYLAKYDFEGLAHEYQVEVLHHSTPGLSAHVEVDPPGGYDLDEVYDQIIAVNGVEHPELDGGDTSPGPLGYDG